MPKRKSDGRLRQAREKVLRVPTPKTAPPDLTEMPEPLAWAGAWQPLTMPEEMPVSAQWKKLATSPEPPAGVTHRRRPRKRRLGTLLTPQERLFATLIGYGASPPEAYRIAWPTARQCDRIIRRVMRRAPVIEAARIVTQHWITAMTTEMRLTREWVIERLMDEAQAVNSPAASRIRALELLGKTSELGLFDPLERSEREMRQRISSDELREQLTALLRQAAAQSPMKPGPLALPSKPVAPDSTDHGTDP